MWFGYFYLFQFIGGVHRFCYLMPQLDIINVVSFVIILCIIVDVLLLYFLSKVKTFTIFVYNVLITKVRGDKNLVNFMFFNETIWIKKQQLKKIFYIF